MNSLRDPIGQLPLALRGLCLATLILLAAPGSSGAQTRQVEGSLSSGARLFRDHCQRCHNPELRNSGLDLSSRESALVGGKQGPALHLDQPEESPVFKKTASGEMPFDVRLPETEKLQLLEWLASAAPWPQYAADGPALPDDEVHRNVREGNTTSSQFTEGKDEQHWAFARTEKPRVPGVEAGNTHPIDAFLLTQQEKLGLTPVGEADRQILVRGDPPGCPGHSYEPGCRQLAGRHRRQPGHLADSTLVVWGGEFGRLPISQRSEFGTQGRDHNPRGFCMWMAGGGIKGGVSYGATDEIGWKAVEGRVSVNDLHATILHLMGLDHERLTYSHNGRPFRLTDVAGRLIHPILA